MSLVSAAIAHLVPMKILGVMCEVLRIGMIAVVRIRPMIAVVRVEMIIYVSVEIVVAMEPRSGSDENASAEPVGTVIAKGSTVVGRVIVITVGTNRFHSDIDGYLGWRSGRGNPERSSGQSGQSKQLP